ncbi:MAG: T9SS type A sorting domain-containing protein [Bacteroidia bacterium]|nr:T9SS type A sorting domain-containing protein [Bacteroidia bacterium]
MFTDTVNNYLYAGGQMIVVDDTVPPTFLIGVARWDGQHWTSMGEVGGSVKQIITYRGELYAAGGYTYLGNAQDTGLAKWNGSEWVSVGSNFNGGVESMCIYNDELVLGGYFTHAGGMPATGLARLYMPPDSACIYFLPAIYTDADTFYLHNDTVSVPFFNNNSHANSWQWNFGDTGTDTVWCPVHIYHQQGVFTVTVHVTELWCNKTANKTIVISDTFNKVSETKNQEATLQIFPNPANNSVTIEITGAVVPFRESKGNGGSELRITDQQGKLVKKYPLKESNSKIEVNTAGWKSGTYICNLVVNSRVVKTEKLVIE